MRLIPTDPDTRDLIISLYRRGYMIKTICIDTGVPRSTIYGILKTAGVYRKPVKGISTYVRLRPEANRAARSLAHQQGLTLSSYIAKLIERDTGL